MSEIVPTLFAFLIHFLLRLTLFFEPPKNGCSSAPVIASIFYLSSTFIIIYDNKLYPEKYKRIPVVVRQFIEMLIIILLLEFNMIFIWCRIEIIIQKLFKCVLMNDDKNLYYDMGGDYLVGFLITLLSFFLFCNVLLATNYYVAMRKKFMHYYKKMVDNFHKFWGGKNFENFTNAAKKCNVFGGLRKAKNEDDCCMPDIKPTRGRCS